MIRYDFRIERKKLLRDWSVLGKYTEHVKQFLDDQVAIKSSGEFYLRGAPLLNE